MRERRREGGDGEKKKERKRDRKKEIERIERAKENGGEKARRGNTERRGVGRI